MQVWSLALLVLACAVGSSDARKAYMRAQRNPVATTQQTLAPAGTPVTPGTSSPAVAGCTETQRADGLCDEARALTEKEILDSLPPAVKGVLVREARTCNSLVAIGEGAGGLVVPSCAVYKTNGPLTLYRAFTDPAVSGKARLAGGYWGPSDPKVEFGGVADYKRRYGICDTWNDGNKIVKCTFPAGLVTTVGQTESVFSGICAGKDLGALVGDERKVLLPRDSTIQFWVDARDNGPGGFAEFKTKFNTDISTIATPFNMAQLGGGQVKCEVYAF